MIKLLLITFCLIETTFQFQIGDEQEFMNLFPTLIKDSFSADLPQDLKRTCKDQSSLSNNLPNQQITSSTTSSEVNKICGTSSICTIETGVTVSMNSNLNVAGLIIKGNLVWNDQTQTSDEQWICAGYIGVGGGIFDMKLVNKKGYIFIKNNNLKHSKLSYRAFGSHDKGKITIVGRTLKRTWSLLAKKIARRVNSISLIHNPQEMGWKIGDRIVIAPNDLTELTGSRATAEDFFIGGFGPNNLIYLKNKNGQEASTSKIYFAESKYVNKETFALVQAEVINLSRNILITGDDFSHVDGVYSSLPEGLEFDKQQASECTAKPNINRKKCTLGLHIIALEEGAVLSLQYTRIEKCGQRGVLGKYCTHLHLVKACPECIILGNAYEYGMQRGTVVHGTHLALVEQNVYNDIRGSSIYIEDGNELYNKIYYNVGICPWPLYEEKHGCTIPGTDNDQSDTIINQSGLWALGFENYAIGNRFANNFNGMLYQEQGFPNGRQTISGKVCNNRQKIGRLEGNTFHHCGRFGTYVLADVFPKNVERTIESNGIPLNKNSDCAAWLSDGSDNGHPTVIKNNVDYRNAFVGQYNAGDLQYKNHISFTNNNLIYWKETKNFQDGCSAHISESFYENGNMALPGGHGTFILENVIFKDKVEFESSHHCNVGVTGVLCMPTYIFTNMSWIGDVNRAKAIIQWHTGDGRGSNNGAMFTLGPNDLLNGNPLFPKDFRSIIHPYWKYLLELDNGLTCFTNEQANQNKDKYLLNNQPYGAILCKKSVRRLEIFSFGNDNRNMVLELYQNNRFISSVVLKYYSILDTNPKKQGYSATIIPGLTHSYKLRMETGDQNVPSDWIIEFSDPVIGNRWQKDEIKLEVAGRNCPPIVNSQHDRRWIWSGEDHLYKTGRGACTNYPEMPIVDCKSRPKITNIDLNCPKCQGNKKCTNGFCDCGSGLCLCEPGFSGINCETDICSSTNCVNGICSAKYLGGDLPVSINRCVCEEGWYGERCDSKNPPSIDVSSLMPCEGQCTGYFPYTCDLNQKIGYCGKTGGCLYGHTTNPFYCCYKGCENEPTTIQSVTQIPTQFPTLSPITDDKRKCEGKCRGSYPFGCSTSNQYGYCNNIGDCYYQSTNDPNLPSFIKDMCCFKGCESEIVKPTSTIQSITQTIQTQISTQSPITDSKRKCEGKCRGSYPFGCSLSQQYGYCNNIGDCYYQSTNDPNLPSFIKDMCCFKGCESEIVKPTSTIQSITQTQIPIQSTTIDNKAKCDGKCKGTYPYGCSSSNQFGYCNLKGDCYYQSTNDPNLPSFIKEMCCFKGC